MQKKGIVDHPKRKRRRGLLARKRKEQKGGLTESSFPQKSFSVRKNDVIDLRRSAWRNSWGMKEEKG